MCCDSGSARNRNKPGYMRGTPRILTYRERGHNRGVRTIRREGRSIGRNPQRLHAGLRRKARRMMIQSTPHGDMGANVNKVSVGEPADGSPPKSHQVKEALAR